MNFKPNQTSVPVWFWPAALGFVTLSVFMICVSVDSELLWEWFNIPHMQPFFADLVAVLAASDARGAGLDPFAIPSPFDPFGRPHVYGPWWLYLHQIGLNRHDAAWLGIGLIVSSISVFSWLLKPKDWLQALVAAAIITSPPFLLAYERGNIDLLVVLVLVIAGLAGPKTSGLILQALLIWVATALKFYPIAAVSLLAHQHKPRQTIIAVSVLGLAIVGAGCVWWGDIHQALRLVPQPETTYGYGLKIIPYIWQNIPLFVGKISFLVGTIVGLGIVVWSGGFRKSLLLAMTEGASTGFFIGGGSTWAFCYFMNVNYPYRVVLLVLAASAWFRIWQTKTGKEFNGARLLVLLFAIMVWMHLPDFKDLLATLDEHYTTGFFATGMEQGFALGLSMVIVAAVVLRFWTRIRTLQTHDTPCGQVRLADSNQANAK
ncbi:MAG: hypothetical protein WC710_15065 [Gallionella sp.]|jgi:hypothetical protein